MIFIFDKDVRQINFCKVKVDIEEKSIYTLPTSYTSQHVMYYGGYMTYQNFIEETTRVMKPWFPTGSDFHSETIKKNNGYYPRALIINEPECSVFPTLYMEDYYKRANNGENIECIARDILEEYHSYKFTEEPDFSFISDFSKIKDLLCVRLINAEKNKDLLKEVPHRPFLDLAIIPALHFFSTEGVIASSVIHNSHLKSWDVSSEDIITMALSNSPKILPGQIRTLPDILNEMAGEILLDDDESTMMHVLSNKSGHHGAAAILYPDLLSGFANRMKKDIFVLPSSIHEIMLLPDNGEGDIDTLTELVQEVNREQLSSVEILSDHAYIYKYQTGEFIQ